MKKKIFTLLTLLVAVCTGAWATDVTFGFGEGEVSVAAFHSTSNNMITSGPISLIGHTTAAGKIISKDGSSDKLKFQAATAITVYAGPAATITSVVITQNGSTRDFSIESGHGSISRSGSVVTWTGSRNSIKITNDPSNNAYVESIAVTYTTNADITSTTAVWDFKNGNPATLATESINTGIEGKEDNVTSSVSSIKMHVNTKNGAAYDGVTGKLRYRSANGDAQCNRGAILQIPVKGTCDIVNVCIKSGLGYTVDGSSEITVNDYYIATATDVSRGYMEIICSTSGYLYSIKLIQYSVSKTITAAGWATYYSPYALDFSSSIANLTKAYLITGHSGATLTLSPISTTIPANTGILLEGEGAVSIPVAASSSTDVSANILKGVTSATGKTAKSIYVLMDEAAGVGFYKNNNDFTVGANTAYIDATDLAGARSFYLFEDDATAIEAVKAQNVENGQFFNLAGQRVAQPTKGLYIVNGKKVIIK